MKLQDLFHKSSLIFDLKATDKHGAIREMLAHLTTQGSLTEEQASQIALDVDARESQASTGIGKGLAIPHAKNSAACPGIFGVFARSAGMDYDAVDGEDVQVLFLVISSAEHVEDHTNIMRGVAKLARDESTLRFLATNADADGVAEILKEFDEA